MFVLSYLNNGDFKNIFASNNKNTILKMKEKLQIFIIDYLKLCQEQKIKSLKVLRDFALHSSFDVKEIEKDISYFSSNYNCVIGDIPFNFSITEVEEI
jgi:hypothetical protein